MIVRSTKIAIELLAALLASLAVIAGLVAWRLSTGPVTVDFLAPYLQSAIDGGDYDVSVGTVELRWDGFERPLQLVASDARLLDPTGAVIATVPQVAVTASVPSLLRGSVAPRRVVLIRPTVQLRRDADGAFRIGLGEGAPSGGVDRDADGVALAWLDQLAAPPTERGGPLSELIEVSIEDGRVIVEDAVLNDAWEAERAGIALRRDDEAVIGDMTFEVMLGDRMAAVTAALRFSLESRRTDLRFSFANVQPDALAEKDPLLGPLSALSMPLEGTLTLKLDQRFQPATGGFAITAGAGLLNLAPLFDQPVSVAAIGLGGTILFDQRRLDVESVSIDLGGPRIAATATIVDGDGLLDIAADAVVLDLPTDLLRGYWPQDAIPGGRFWVTRNLTRGVVRRADARLRATVPAFDPGAMDIETLAGTIRFDGVTVTYLDGMPPVTDVAGTATFDAAGFDLALTGGRLDDLTVPEAAITISGLDSGREAIDINVAISGPLSTALEVLDRPRLGYVSAVGIDPGDTSGEMSARLRLTFPLIADLAFSDVAVATSARLRRAALGEVVPGLRAEEVEGELSLDGLGLTGSGTGALNGVPVTFDWTERFADGGDFVTRIALTGTPDSQGRAALGLPVYDGLSGPTPLSVLYTDIDRTRQTLEADFDLTPARLTVEAIGFDKPAGTEGQAEVDVTLDNQSLTRISRFLVRTSDLWAEGSAEFDPQDERLTGVTLDRFEYGAHMLSARIDPGGGNGYAVEARGPRLDASRIFESLADDDPAPSEGGTTGSPEAPPSPGPDLTVTLDFEEVVLGEQRSLRNVNGVLDRQDGAWTTIDLAGQTNSGGGILVRYLPGGDGGQRLLLESDNAGAALEALDVSTAIEGGQLAIEGTRPSADGPLAGQVRVQNYRLSQAPAVARLLSALSIPGIQNLAASEGGINFARMTSDFSFQDGTLSLRNGRTSGGSLGLTFDGTIDVDANRADIQGTIVPVIGVNNVIGAIPLLGDLLTGGEGGGLFAFTYGVRGSLDDPTVTVNPLSVLAPGFLRNLFFLDNSNGDADAEPRLGPLIPDRRDD
ncbi:MAG: YhdP family protein [Inquilinaceae bacterium]